MPKFCLAPLPPGDFLCFAMFVAQRSDGSDPEWATDATESSSHLVFLACSRLELKSRRVSKLFRQELGLLSHGGSAVALHALHKQRSEGFPRVRLADCGKGWAVSNP